MNTTAASVLAIVLYLVALCPAMLIYLGRDRSAAASFVALLALAVLGSFVS